MKSLIGAATYNRIRAFAQKAKKEGLSPAGVIKALRAKFGKSLRIKVSGHTFVPITRGK